ncbi:MAG: hypothetical protein ACJAXA_000080 [Candidatus Aldehydirespiratoraceae bacterium]
MFVSGLAVFELCSLRQVVRTAAGLVVDGPSTTRRAPSFSVFSMDDGRENTQNQNSLFDRIAREIAETSSAFPADETAGLMQVDESLPGGILLEREGAWPAPDSSTQIERPIIANRQCSRTGCADAAAITLSYHYGTSQVWIDHLTPEREPHMYDMCDRHADGLSVMRGWHLDDRRGARRGALIAV